MNLQSYKIKMARETKAERIAREEKYEAEQLELCRAAYPTELMQLLERVCNLPRHFDMRIKDGQFIVNSHEYQETYKLSLEFSKVNHNTLDSLTWNVSCREEDERHAAELEAARRTALGKLTAEEKKLLGL